MKNNNLINFCLICFLIFLIVYNLSKYRENITNNCPTQQEVDQLKEKNESLNSKLDENQKIIQENQKTIQDNKIANVKNFCDQAKANFEALNEKVKKKISSMKETIQKNKE